MDSKGNEEEVWEPEPAGEDEDYACDECMMPLMTGMVRYHSTTNDEYDICEKCHSSDLEKKHKFQKFVVQKDNFPKDFDPTTLGLK
jgi:hypothetical protein